MSLLDLDLDPIFHPDRHREKLDFLKHPLLAIEFSQNPVRETASKRAHSQDLVTASVIGIERFIGSPLTNGIFNLRYPSLIPAEPVSDLLSDFVPNDYLRKVLDWFWPGPLRIVRPDLSPTEASSFEQRSNMDHAKRGANFLSEKEYLSAATEYTLALIEHPTSPEYYIQRSIVLTRLSKHELALQDANKAVVCGHKRAKRESIQEGQHRRVVAYYNLGQYANARFVLNNIQKWLDKKETEKKKEDKEQGIGEDKSKGKRMNVDMWSAKVELKLKTLDQEQELTAEEKPAITFPSEQQAREELRRQIKNGKYNIDWQTEVPKKIDILSTSEPQPTSSPVPAIAPPNKIRHEWYQNAQSVIITLYAKGVDKDKTEFNIKQDSVSVSFPTPSDPASSASFDFDPLFALINPAESTYRILSTKIEITLRKAQAGIKWHNIEGTEPLTPSTTITTTVPAATVMPPKTAPVYPTSSKSGPKDWDKLAASYTKTKSNSDESKSKSKSKSTPKSAENDDSSSNNPDENDDQVDSDSEGGDAVDSFFKKLYKGADPDTRRAMMKSFTESNGTALSTNWSEVGKGKVDVVESKSDD